MSQQGNDPGNDDAAAQAAAAAEAERVAAEEAARAAAANKDTRTAEELAAELARVNAESAARRLKIKEYEDAEAKRSLEGKSDVDRAKAAQAAAEARATELEGQLAKASLGESVATAATKLGFRNPAIAARLVDLASVTDDDGKVDPAKVDAELKKALKADPYLGGSQSNDGGARSTSTGGDGKTDMNKVIRKAVGIDS